MSTHTFQFCEDKLGHRGVQCCRQHDRCLLTASCYYRYFMMFVPWISNDRSPITISFLTSRPNACLTSPPEANLSSFLQKLRKFLEKIHSPCCQRQLTHHHFLPPYPSITLFSSDFSKPLGSTLFCLHCSYLVTYSWTPSINIFSSIFLPWPLSFPAPLHELSPSQSFPSTNGGFKTIPISSSKELFLKQWQHCWKKGMTS